jgi:ParB-like chromosome segregation protein Spo0J
MTAISKTGFHPAADLFPLMSETELKEMADDIKKRGLIFPIVREKNGLIIAGRNRFLACQIAGVNPTFELFDGTEAEIIGFVIAENILRRHLNVEQRQDLLTKLIAMTPEKSDRQIGKQIGVDHKTVGKARRKGVDMGTIPHVEKRTDAKGRKRRFVAKPKTPSLALVEAVKAKAKADEATVDAPVVKAKPGTIAPASTVALSNFIYACNTWLPKLDTADRGTARTHFQKTMARLNGQAEISIEEHQAEMAKLAETGA